MSDKEDIDSKREDEGGGEDAPSPEDTREQIDITEIETVSSLASIETGHHVDISQIVEQEPSPETDFIPEEIASLEESQENLAEGNFNMKKPLEDPEDLQNLERPGSSIASSDNQTWFESEHIRDVSEVTYLEVDESTATYDDDFSKDIEKSKEDGTEILIADKIYLLMEKEYRLSRSTRALWFFSKMDEIITVQNRADLSQFTGGLDVISVMPQDPVPSEWDWDTGHLYKYKVTSSTMVTFLSRQYKFVYILDFSPSAANSDIKKNCILLEQKLKALRRSLAGVIRPFTVPGSQVLFTPDIYVTVIAWTPFLCPGAQSVLHQGCLVTPHNLEHFLDVVAKGLNELENRIARIASFVIDELEQNRLQAERIVGDLFEESDDGASEVPNVPMAAPDTGFMHMIQTGMLSLQLLPDNSSASILVITDGVLSVPDINHLDNLLSQLRNKSICLSFLEVSSSYHPHAGFGYCPYNEVMAFMSLATSGAYLPRVPEILIEPTEPYLYEMNQYHEAFLAWSFRKCLDGIELKAPMVETDKNLWRKGRYTEIKNPHFVAVAEEGLICKKRLEMTVNTNLTSVLSCRLREGYTVNTVRVMDNEIRVKLTMPWKYHTFIHYTVFSVWPSNNKPDSYKCRVEVSVEGPYDIIYDIICQTNKNFSSFYRNSVIKKFYSTLHQLSQTDKLLVHLNSFAANPLNYTMPDTVQKGLPLFMLSPATGAPVPYSQDTNPSFGNFWRPVFSLDITVWHRWMHTHRITVLLQHDQPLPKHLLMSSSTGRYHHVLSKKSASKVYELIKSSTAFCLLENHSYINFIKNENSNSPTSFYVVKVTSKPPCLVVWVAFLGAIPGSERHRIVTDLRDQLAEITMKQRVSLRDLPSFKMKPAPEDTDSLTSPTNTVQGISSSQFPDVYCCVLFSKPIEKILIRYQDVPSDYSSLHSQLYGRSTSPQLNSGQQDVAAERSKNATVAFLTLSRYLNHQRWIYSLQFSPCVPISQQAVTRILNLIVKIRIQQGFTFAHSSKGIQNLVMEVPLIPERCASRQTVPQSCIVQYLIFPPHILTSNSCRESVSDSDYHQDSARDEVSTESDGEAQIILETWTEPQDGLIPAFPPMPQLTDKRSSDIASTIYPQDFECISTLVTFEHLAMMCQNPCIPSPLNESIPLASYSLHTEHQFTSTNVQDKFLPGTCDVKEVPFAYDLMNLITKAHQTEMLFSLFIQDLSNSMPDNPYTLTDIKFPSDRPNEMLFECLLKELGEAADRELILSAADCEKLPEVIMKRQHKKFQFVGSASNSTSFRQSYLSTPYPSTNAGHCRYDGAPPSCSNLAAAASRRYPSGNSRTSSAADTHRDLHSQQDYSTSECISLAKKWKCFLKAISPTHIVFTFLPASLEDLRSLTMSQEAMDGRYPDIIDIINKEMPSESKDTDSNLDDLSINSSIPNLESVSSELTDLRSPRLEVNQQQQLQNSRQRSGSDVFEMNRPKMQTVRKSSGEPAVMRDRTLSLDGLSQFKAKALLRKKQKEARERDRTDSMGTNASSSGGAQDSSGSGTAADTSSTSTSSRSRRHASGYGKTNDPQSMESLASSNIVPPLAPMVSLQPKHVVGSMTIPIYIYDCHVHGLTNSLILKENVDKPETHYMNYLFKPEKNLNKISAMGGESTYGASERNQKTPEPHISEDTEYTGHIDKGVRSWYQAIQMIYYKSFVNVLFRSLQLKHTIHSYDIQQAVNYCDNDTACDVELSTFVKSVCPHFPSDMETELDIEKLKTGASCVSQDSWYKAVQKKFMEIVGSKFKVVPGHKDLFFFCPPGLELSDFPRSGSRRQDETKSSESTCRRHNSDQHKSEEDDKTIEFRSNASQQSLRLQKLASMTETENETAQRELHSSLSSPSHFDQDWDLDDDDVHHRGGEGDDLSPPLFIQFSFNVRQAKEDIISVPVSYLPSCLCEIFQDKNIPDPEQMLHIETLGLRIDFVCITLPRESRFITENIGGLRSTSLCSTLSCRDSRSMHDDDDFEDIADLIADHSDDLDVLSHLPTYQHKAVMDIKDEVNWMIMDEIAFALTKSSSLSKQTLEFVCRHVQASSRIKPGSRMESINLEFVFGSEKSFKKFREHFGKINLQGISMKKEEDFYYLDWATGKRKSLRPARLAQLSPVKESILCSPPEVTIPDEGSEFSETASYYISNTGERVDGHSIDIELKSAIGLGCSANVISDRNFCLRDWNLIIQLEKERVLIFLHYREQIDGTLNTLNNLQSELKGIIKNISVKVNQDMLLRDLFENKSCNRLLEPESNEDAWRDSSRSGGGYDYDEYQEEGQYLEANMNRRWSPGKFKCPEIWRTTFSLHPRLKQGSQHNGQSWGIQAIRTVLFDNMIHNRSNMFVYMDDKRNIFYIKICEQIQSHHYSHSVLSRQTSIAVRDEDVFSRTSSIGSSKQMKRNSGEIKEDFSFQSRSNSVGEHDKVKSEDQIIFKVYGIEEVGANIKEDLTAVLQKKLDDKVVEAISIMLKRNPRCQLSSEDVQFLQKPGSQPSTVLRFKVQPKAMGYMMAIIFYMKQNIIQVPNIMMPNYSAGNTKRLRDIKPNEELHLSPNQTIHDSDIFLYNDHNEKGGRNGLACVCLSLVDEKGDPANQMAYPVATSTDLNGCEFGESFLTITECGSSNQQEMNTLDDAETNVDNESIDDNYGPTVLIQFRIWESGRVDIARLTSLLEDCIKQALWDTVTEYKILTEPLCIRENDDDDLSVYNEDQDKSTSDEIEEDAQYATNKRKGSGEKLSLKILSKEARIAYGFNESNTSMSDIPKIIVEGREASELLDETSFTEISLSKLESGDSGQLAGLYTSSAWSWFKQGKDIDVPSHHMISINLACRYEIKHLIRELSSLIVETVTGMDVKLFNSVQTCIGDQFVPMTMLIPDSKIGKEVMLVARNFDVWKQIVNVRPDLTFIKKSYCKFIQSFPSLIDSPALIDIQTPHNTSQGTLPVTPTTPSLPQVMNACVEHNFIPNYGTSELFVPRQTFLLGRVTTGKLELHCYNLTKDCLEKLETESSQLGQWFTARATLFASIVTQKLGLFNNQAFLRQTTGPASKYIGDANQVENLAKHTAHQITGKPKYNCSDVQNMFKNKKLSHPIKLTRFGGAATAGRNSTAAVDHDVMKKTAKQISDILTSDNRQLNESLFMLWHSRGENSGVQCTEELMKYFKQKARMIHYVYTPILFLPKWRQNANATRDSGLPTSSVAIGSGGGTGLMAGTDDASPGRVRNNSTSGGGPALVGQPRTKRSRSITGQNLFSSPAAKSPISSPKVSRIESNQERYHAELISSYLQEYEQYLQTRDFTVLTMSAGPSRRMNRYSSETASGGNRRPVTSTRSRQKVVYLLKSLRGGLLVFEIGFSEPFFYTKLHALEATRWFPLMYQNINPNKFMSPFLEECDNVKFFIHLHSFTYDYHLRAISGYIRRKSMLLGEGFHVVSFLEDFLKYYSKGPNYARNFTYSGSLHIIIQGVSPQQVFNYILENKRMYDMEGLKMEPMVNDSESETDHILVQFLFHRVQYRDPQDAKIIDEFDVSLIISYDECYSNSESQPNILPLKYYVLMTSKRDMLPRQTVEKKPGNFRTVVPAMAKKNLFHLSTQTETVHSVYIPRAPTPPLVQPLLPHETEKMQEILDSAENATTSDTSVKSQILSKLTGIRRESVNYVGYYSLHEEKMKEVIHSQARMAEERIKILVRDAMVDCKRDQLWKRLLTNNPPLSYQEFVNLTTLVHSDTLEELDPSLASLLNKSTTWYENLAKLVTNKYANCYRQYNDPNGEVQHTAILTDSTHESNGTFTLVSVNYATKEGNLAIVYREPPHTTQSSLVSANSKIIEEFVEFCCFHLWTQLL